MMLRCYSICLCAFLLSGQTRGRSAAQQSSNGQDLGADLKTCILANANNASNDECIKADALSDQEQNSTDSISAVACLDDRPECPNYAKRGDCRTNPRFMHAHCKDSCNVCPSNLQYFDSDYGEPQEISGKDFTKIEERIRKVENYMKTKVAKHTMYHSVRDSCINRDKLCSKWASEGECEKNPSWMHIHCAPACFSCEKLDHRIRCPFNPNAPKAWEPGDLDGAFLKIITDPHYWQYQPKILSRPPKELTTFVPAVHDTRVPQGDAPWVLELESFLTDEECDRLIELGAQVGYKQSYEVGGKNFDGTFQAADTDDRTSYNAWCFEKECYEDKTTQQILAKVENVTGIPEKNYEFFQLLKYEKGGLYRRHSDYIPSDFQRAQGVRILTFFIYLNDMEDEEAGGQTAFPRLNLKVTPKKGKALLWPNVFMRNPDARDSRTDHEALPVRKGIKYAANLWIHQRDFKRPFYDLCN